MIKKLTLTKGGLLDDIFQRRHHRLPPMRHNSARHRCRDSRSPLQPPGGAEEPPQKVPRLPGAKKESPTGDIHYDVIEWWPESKNEPERIFIDIVALHEELIALDNMGRLHQWSWYDHLPYVSQDWSTIFCWNFLSFSENKFFYSAALN